MNLPEQFATEHDWWAEFKLTQDEKKGRDAFFAELERRAEQRKQWREELLDRFGDEV